MSLDPERYCDLCGRLRACTACGPWRLAVQAHCGTCGSKWNDVPCCKCQENAWRIWRETQHRERQQQHADQRRADAWGQIIMFLIFGIGPILYEYVVVSGVFWVQYPDEWITIAMWLIVIIMVITFAAAVSGMQCILCYPCCDSPPIHED